MMKNIQDHGSQIPQLNLLIKDHKTWSEDSGEPIPSRPVLSGNCCINTHLSELAAELLEPISMTLTGADIFSSEEALCKITELNKKIRSGELNELDPEHNVLRHIGVFKYKDYITECGETAVSSEEDELGRNTMEEHKETDSCARLPVDNTEENLIIDILQELAETGYAADVLKREEMARKRKSLREKQQSKIQSRITDFWKIGERKTVGGPMENFKLTKKTRIKQLEAMQEVLKSKSENAKYFPDKLENDMYGSVIWGRKLDLMEENKVTAKKDRIEQNVRKNIQNFQQKPVLLGADVAALYPNLEKTITGELIYRSVLESDIKFDGMDYTRMAIYLTLVLGIPGMHKSGLSECIPRRINSESNSRSLNNKLNRDMTNWKMKDGGFSESMKRKLLGRLLQVITLVLMNTSCYSFGGKIFRQKKGAGIGERASACVAKLTMSLWDKLWASEQCMAGLWIPLFIRYIDDIRVYVFPINNGWSWNGEKWMYDENNKDDLNYEERTKKMLLKTFNSVLESITLTAESEAEFSNGMLPTLDFQTRVRNDGEIEFKYFSKPMASGLLIQKGSALAKQTIFSSLRQDLIRRMCNISDHFCQEELVRTVEEFTQALSNSGHKYSFSKSVILQAITRYKFMKERDGLDEENERFRPLYRDRSYQFSERCKLKYTEPMTWYTNVKVGDKFKHHWKFRIKRKGYRRKGKYAEREKEEKTKKIDPSTVIFIPSTEGGKLLKKLETVENEFVITDNIGWTTKMVEKSGSPLANLFGVRFPIHTGCPLGQECTICDNDAVKCNTKSVVYEVVCMDCKEESKDQRVWNKSDPRYIGETSRPFRMRAYEHWTNLKEMKNDSFMLIHWMSKHGLQMYPPEYKFSKVGTFGDSLTRQITEAILIEQYGNLNKKSEFGVNHLSRLDVQRSEQEKEYIMGQEAAERANLLSNLECFVTVVKNVLECVQAPSTNSSHTCRSKIQNKRKMEEVLCGQGEKNKKSRVNATSTPIWGRREAPSTPPDLISPIRGSPVINFANGSFKINTMGHCSNTSSSLSNISIETSRNRNCSPCGLK